MTVEMPAFNPHLHMFPFLTMMFYDSPQTLPCLRLIQRNNPPLLIRSDQYYFCNNGRSLFPTTGTDPDIQGMPPFLCSHALLAFVTRLNPRTYIGCPKGWVPVPASISRVSNSSLVTRSQQCPPPFFFSSIRLNKGFVPSPLFSGCYVPCLATVVCQEKSQHSVIWASFFPPV